jgi:hypothetical protein
VYLGAEDTSDDTHLWFGCSSSISSCPSPDGTGRAGGTFCSRKAPTNDCTSFCGQRVINDGKWHHLAIVKRGHAPAQLRLFVDGNPDLPAGDITTEFHVPIAFDSGTQFTAGAFSNGVAQAAGTFDEVAVWRRALSDAEVAALYDRGSLQLSLRTRACNSPDCAENPAFVGPSGEGSVFKDDAPASAPGALALPAAMLGRYFQYEVVFVSQLAAHSPTLFAVSLIGEP